MAKTIYRREKLEPELGRVGAQNFMSRQVERAVKSPRCSKVCRVWHRDGDKRVLDQVIISGQSNYQL
ncbi:hypothetical protein KGB44_gp75 [Salmonella virus VSt472]|uniref:DUF7540 domain-containing protein n=1 Tax=Salmonella virus VSt472 TaxID=2301723 RepID=A0A385EH83_9CAUD|nr:hypothetical protein KGB44_gp75 [Salmonella virus VSt472]AXQ70392.1 hypothetical protein vst472_75 [Salmonella virus VSt472]